MLLEIIIALTVFAVVVAGLASVLHSSLDSANILRRQAAIRRGLEATLIEAENKPKREEMQMTAKDEALGVEYTTELEELKWINRKGKPLRGMYVLRVSAKDLRSAKPLNDRAELYVYRP